MHFLFRPLPAEQLLHPGDRDSNRGECVQCCRFKYNVVEEKRPGQYFPVVEDERGTYIFNSKDLCLLPYLPDLYDAGFTSLKIEGRMKSIHYVATVTKVYRQAFDAYEADPEHFTVRQEWLDELEKISHRLHAGLLRLPADGGRPGLQPVEQYPDT